MEYPYKEVYFDKYCPKCENRTKTESDDPCWDCLNEPSNVESHKPIFFKEDLNVKREARKRKRL